MISTEKDFKVSSSSNYMDMMLPYCDVYAGSSGNCCRGQLSYGKSAVSPGCTFLGINGGLSIFYYFYGTASVQYQLLACIVLFHFMTVATMLMTIFTEPGIVPRINLHSNTCEEQLLIPGPYRSRDNRYVVSREGIIELRYCDTCKIYKTPRAAHCRFCDNCVQDFDHHCKWLGTCIGRRNYQRFFAFVSSLSTTLFLVAAQLGLLYRTSKWDIILMLLIVSAFLMFTFSLWLYHIYLSFFNLTTYEHLVHDEAVSAELKLMGLGVRRRLSQVLRKIVLLPTRLSFIRFYQLVFADTPVDIKIINSRLRQGEKQQNNRLVYSCVAPKVNIKSPSNKDSKQNIKKRTSTDISLPEVVANTPIILRINNKSPIEHSSIQEDNVELFM